MDKALLRPGRFDKHVYVNLPDIRGRHAIVSLYLKRIPLAKDVDVEVLAKVTPGFSGADLYKFVNMAKIRASIEIKREMQMQHLDHVRDEMILGVERKTAMTLEDSKLTAYHESGDALVALFTPDTHPIHKATIIPRENALGMIAQVPEKDEYSVTKAQLLARLDVAMGGQAAEHLVFGSDRVTTGASNDFGQATKIAQAMVTKYGMFERVGNAHFTNEDLSQISGELRAKIESEVSNLLDASYARAIFLLQMHRNELDSLANPLLDDETLTREEIVQVQTPPNLYFIRIFKWLTILFHSAQTIKSETKEKRNYFVTNCPVCLTFVNLHHFIKKKNKSHTLSLSLIRKFLHSKQTLE